MSQSRKKGDESPFLVNSVAKPYQLRLCCFLSSESNFARTSNSVTSEAHCCEVKCICFFCIYGFCLDYVHRLSCCLVRYLTLSNLFHPHQKHTINYFYCRQGFRPPIIIHFWWRWRLVAGRVQHAFTTKGLQQFFSTY